MGLLYSDLTFQCDFVTNVFLPHDTTILSRPLYSPNPGYSISLLIFEIYFVLL
jgi:hypothetical protein